LALVTAPAKSVTASLTPGFVSINEGLQ
jgi:hypothetical protein